MSIRWKLNIVVALLVVVFLLTAGFATRAVRGYMAYVRTHSVVREHADLTANLRVGVYRYFLRTCGASSESTPPDRPGWLEHTLHDIELQARVAETDEERRLWSDLHSVLTALPDVTAIAADQASFDRLTAPIDKSLASLRRRFQKAEFDAVDAMAAKSEQARRAIWIAGGFIVLLFLWYVILVREWLVRPVDTLRSAADSIGADTFSGRITLDGTDELAQLARHMESMAQRLATHQAELLQARELSAVGELCTSVAHGLRNPLAAMRRAANLPAGLDKGSEASAERLAIVLKDVMRQVERMSDRITKLMEFSRPRELHRDRVTFRQIALTARAHVRELFEQQGVTLTIDDQSTACLLHVDCDELAQALAELAANALRHCASGSEIVLKSEPLPAPDDRTEQLRIQVIDDGAGMAPAEVDKAFNIFYTSRADGTGMGLAMVRRAVQRHGGEVSLESEIGTGTTVTIVLPTADPETDEPRNAPGSVDRQADLTGR